LGAWLSLPLKPFPPSSLPPSLPREPITPFFLPMFPWSPPSLPLTPPAGDTKRDCLVISRSVRDFFKALRSFYWVFPPSLLPEPTRVPSLCFPMFSVVSDTVHFFLFPPRLRFFGPPLSPFFKRRLNSSTFITVSSVPCSAEFFSQVDWRVLLLSRPSPSP